MIAGIKSVNADHKHKLGNRFFYLWAGVVIRFRWLFLLLTLALTVFFGTYLATGLSIDTNIERYLDPNSKSVAVIEELRDTFGQDKPFLITIRGDVFTLPYLNRLKKLHRELESITLDIESLGQRRQLGDRSTKTDSLLPQQMAEDEATFEDFIQDDEQSVDNPGPIVQDVISLINYREIRWRNDGLEDIGLLENWPTQKELGLLKKRVLSDEKIVGFIIDKNGENSVISVRTDFMSDSDMGLVYREIERICDRYRNPDFYITVTGVPALVGATNDLILSDQVNSTALAVVVVILAAFFIFRHFLGVLGPFLVVILADIWTLGLMGFLRVPITTATTLISVFVVCVGVGDAVHIQSVYRNVRKADTENRKAIMHAMSVTGIPVLYTSLTTLIGLLSLRFASLSGIKEMGTFSAFGVAAALINSLVILPIVLSFNRNSLLGLSPSTDNPRRLDRLLDFCSGLSRPKPVRGRLVYTRRNSLLLFSAFAVIFIISGLSLLRVYHDTLEWYPKDHPIYRAVMQFEKAIGGVSTITLLIESKNGKDLTDKATLDALERLERYIENYRDPSKQERLVHNTMSFLNFVRESWRAVHGNKPEYDRIPQTQRGVTDMLTLLENAAGDDLRNFITVDMKQAPLIARVKWMNTAEYQPLYRYIQNGIDHLVGDKASIKLTGSVVVGVEVLSSLVWDMLKSFGGAVGIITIVMLLLLIDIRLGLMAMIPNLLPVLSVIASMGFSSIPLDTTTVMLGSIAIGIVVDDTIHFLYQFRIHYRNHGNVEDAIRHAYNHSGRAMIITSCILICGFMCNQVSVLLCFKITGTLLSLMIALALITDLCLCPAILRLIYRTKPRSIIVPHEIKTRNDFVRIR